MAQHSLMPSKAASLSRLQAAWAEKQLVSGARGLRDSARMLLGLERGVCFVKGQSRDGQAQSHGQGGAWAL